ncbi:MAG TPA: hypothetical protein VM346_00285, partial [Sphingomicrobium sp.]|nr:hypothetical protein [Sphingomicrobium sp.]
MRATERGKDDEESSLFCCSGFNLREWQVLNPAQKYTVGPRSKLLAALALLASATTGAIASDSVEEAGQQLYLSGHAAPVDGTRTINLLCMGSGSPTVILTAGLGDWG